MNIRELFIAISENKKASKALQEVLGQPANDNLKHINQNSARQIGLFGLIAMIIHRIVT